MKVLDMFPHHRYVAFCGLSAISFLLYDKGNRKALLRLNLFDTLRTLLAIHATDMHVHLCGFMVIGNLCMLGNASKVIASGCLPIVFKGLQDFMHGGVGTCPLLPDRHH